MKKRAQTNYKKHIIVALFRLIPLILLWSIYAMLIKPPEALAKPSGTSYCQKGGCHTTVDSNATMWVARDGISLASGQASPTVTVFIGAGRTVEFDWYGNDFSNSAGGYGAGIAIHVPTSPSTWTVASGTLNSPNLTNWSTAWDVTDGVGWNNTNLAQEPAGFWGATVNYDLTVWDNGGNNGARDNGVTGNPGDQDGMANRHGVDGKVTSPSTVSGNYSIYLDIVGHEGSTKSYMRSIAQVRIANITSLSTDKSSYNTLGENIVVTGNYNNTSTSTNLSNSTIDYQIFIDSNGNGNLNAGETYIDSAGYPQTASTGNETTKVTSAFNVNANTTVQDQWSINNQEFTSAIDYTLKAIWKEGNGGVIDVEKDPSPFYTFYSVPTLGYPLLFLTIAFFVGMFVKKGVLRPRMA